MVILCNLPFLLTPSYRSTSPEGVRHQELRLHVLQIWRSMCLTWGDLGKMAVIFFVKWWSLGYVSGISGHSNHGCQMSVTGLKTTSHNGTPLHSAGTHDAPVGVVMSRNVEQNVIYPTTNHPPLKYTRNTPEMLGINRSQLEVTSFFGVWHLKPKQNRCREKKKLTHLHVSKHK